MLATNLLAAVAALLTPQEIVFVQIPTLTVLNRVPTPGRGAAVFAAPDGRIVVPMTDSDKTFVTDMAGKTEEWTGRVFPLFFDEADHMHTIMPGQLVTLSYPDRVPLNRMPLPGVKSVRRAACSGNGRLVAILPTDEGAQFYLALPRQQTNPQRVTLSYSPALVIVGPNADFAVTASHNGVIELSLVGQLQSIASLSLGVETHALAFSSDARDVIVGFAGESGGLVILRPTIGRKPGLKERYRVALQATPMAIAASGKNVLVLLPDHLLIIGKAGKGERRNLPLPGAFQFVLLPEKLRSALPEWSD